MTDNTTQKPEMILNDGAIKATIWKREGPKGSFYTTAFAKIYRDEKGDYQNSQSFSGADLLKISELAKQAYQQSRELYYKDQRNNQMQKERAPENSRER